MFISGLKYYMQAIVFQSLIVLASKRLYRIYVKELLPESFRNLLRLSDYQQRLAQVTEWTNVIDALSQFGPMPSAGQAATDLHHPAFMVSRGEDSARFDISPVTLNPEVESKTMTVLVLGATSLTPTKAQLSYFQTRLGESGAIGAIAAPSSAGTPLVLYLRAPEDEAFAPPDLLEKYHAPKRFVDIPRAVAGVGLRSYLNSPPLQHLLSSKNDLSLFRPSHSKRLQILGM